MTDPHVPLDRLAELGLDQLRSRWRSRYGAPPSIRSRELLALMLAWRLQAERDGGMETSVRRAMRRPGASRGLAALPPGARLSREWKGMRHDVIVEGDGRLRWEGGLFNSLSEVARAITGTRWNGPRFFGLREEGR